MTSQWSQKQKTQLSRAQLASNKLENKRNDFSIITEIDKQKTYYVSVWCWESEGGGGVGWTQKWYWFVIIRTRILEFLGVNTIKERQSYKLIAAENGTAAGSATMKFPTIILLGNEQFW